MQFHCIIEFLETKENGVAEIHLRISQIKRKMAIMMHKTRNEH